MSIPVDLHQWQIIFATLALCVVAGFFEYFDLEKRSMFKIYKSIIASLFYTLLLFGNAINSVHAQESSWYGGVSIGEASILEEVYDDSTPTSFYIGRRYNESTSFEFGYLDLGGFESAPDDPDYDASADISGFVVSALGFIKTGESAAFFGKAGLYIWDGEEKINGIDSDDSDVSLLWGLGFDFPFGAKFGARADYVQYLDIGNEDSDTLNLELYVNF